MDAEDDARFRHPHRRQRPEGRRDVARRQQCMVTGFGQWPMNGDRLTIDGQLWRVVEIRSRALPSNAD